MTRLNQQARVARGVVDYCAGSSARAGYQGFDADIPTPGFYRTRLRSGAVYVGVHIWFGPPKDPATGEEMDRAARWQAEVNGRYVDLATVWPGCARDPINAQEYAYLAAQQAWGERAAPQSPQADPTRRVDLLTAPLPF